jgi:pimeloyl-ACP methyl ester carboxylesterase
MAIEDRLRTLHAPTLIVWGTDDCYFDARWAQWLERTIPGTRRRVELEGARLFFPEERWRQLNDELRDHWMGASASATRTVASQPGQSPSRP